MKNLRNIVMIGVLVITSLFSCEKVELDPIDNNPSVTDTTQSVNDTVVDIDSIITVDTFYVLIGGLERSITTDGEITWGDHYTDNHITILLDKGESVELDITVLPCNCALNTYTLEVYINGVVVDSKTESYGDGWVEQPFNYKYQN